MKNLLFLFLIAILASCDVSDDYIQEHTPGELTPLIFTANETVLIETEYGGVVLMRGDTLELNAGYNVFFALKGDTMKIITKYPYSLKY